MHVCVRVCVCVCVATFSVLQQPSKPSSCLPALLPVPMASCSPSQYNAASPNPTHNLPTPGCEGVSTRCPLNRRSPLPWPSAPPPPVRGRSPPPPPPPPPAGRSFCASGFTASPSWSQVSFTRLPVEHAGREQGQRMTWRVRACMHAGTHSCVQRTTHADPTHSLSLEGSASARFAEASLSRPGRGMHSIWFSGQGLVERDEVHAAKRRLQERMHACVRARAHAHAHTPSQLQNHQHLTHPACWCAAQGP